MKRPPKRVMAACRTILDCHDGRPPGLTDRQQDILAFIRESMVKEGYPPTVREIGSHFGILSTNGVVGHLRALEQTGAITREPAISRGICLAGVSVQKALAAGKVVAKWVTEVTE